MEIALRLWLVLAERDRAALRDQIGFSWDRNAEELVRFAARDAWIAGTVRSFLTSDGGRLAEFDRLLSRHLREAARRG